MCPFIVTEEDIRNARPTQLGGLSFAKFHEVHQIPSPRLNVAVPMTPAEFREDYMGENGFHYLKEYYSSLRTYAAGFSFVFEEALPADDYGVFSFTYDNSKGWQSLAAVNEPLDAALALEIFRKLLLIIKEYSRSGLHAAGYRPMGFICRDSVYVRFDADKQPEVCLLPMPVIPTTDYVGLPRKMDDLYTDVYMAAYLYLDMKYPYGAAFSENHEVDRLAEQCLSLFPQRRPSLDELIVRLENLTDAAGVAPATTDVAESEAAFEDDEEYEDEPAPRRESGLSRMVQQRMSGIKKGKEKVKRAFDEVRDRFDEHSSTEDGDAEEEDDE